MYNDKINTGFVSPEMPKARADINRFRSKKTVLKIFALIFPPSWGKKLGEGGEYIFPAGKKINLVQKYTIV